MTTVETLVKKQKLHPTSDYFTLLQYPSGYFCQLIVAS